LLSSSQRAIFAIDINNNRKDFMSMKNPLAPAGIEPATFRFVAQRLNHCATVVPETCREVKINILRSRVHSVYEI